MHGQIWPQAVDIYEKIFASLTPRETERLRAILDKLMGAVKAIEGGAK
jgi:hypothetical protein